MLTYIPSIRFVFEMYVSVSRLLSVNNFSLGDIGFRVNLRMADESSVTENRIAARNLGVCTVYSYTDYS